MKTRIITAIVALIVFIPFVVIGGIPFELMSLLLATIAVYEILVMVKQPVFSISGIVTILLTWLVTMPDRYLTIFHEIGLSKMELIFIGIAILLAYTVFSRNKFHFDQAGVALLASIYVGFGFHYLSMTRDAGLYYVIFALLIVWSTDTGAYFIGRQIGKRKLAPHVSPNKTVAGFVGGIVCALIVAGGFYYFADLPLAIGLILVALIVLSIFGQLGDLVESALKRYYGVKDSGKILPGHGGILDRFDSLLFVLPLLHILQII
ncbi:phosphatidate cytidylyltransferase [Listeria fleischmannii]|uniref:Phosphatidate cytidylyltransferase n=1 Tax=Listeria fleischmannii FSL S10-1203 TaxID=1265822 RepID=W7DQW9_9LIST|nr:phosphatidate cytidylyltransferase [Listeria fleischmannii]EUJ60900.1 phosphatidate cytidylyltransferase [Listeria fleischmannii FSL S10-1203]STY34750.1 Phosphatidate cytidylyltransferase [Listeria fleischmannii subsp. coloradonensis]